MIRTQHHLAHPPPPTPSCLCGMAHRYQALSLHNMIIFAHTHTHIYTRACMHTFMHTCTSYPTSAYFPLSPSYAHSLPSTTTAQGMLIDPSSCNLSCGGCMYPLLHHLHHLHHPQPTSTNSTTMPQPTPRLARCVCAGGPSPVPAVLLGPVPPACRGPLGQRAQVQAVSAHKAGVFVHVLCTSTLCVTDAKDYC
jgi:hypothetical protein